MDNSIKERFVRMINELCGGNKSEFTRRIDRPVTAVKDIIGGKGTYPSYELLYAVLSSDLGISPDWLMLGNGPMLRENSQASGPKETPMVNINHVQTVNIGNWNELAELLKTIRQ